MEKKIGDTTSLTMVNPELQVSSTRVHRLSIDLPDQGRITALGQLRDMTYASQFISARLVQIFLFNAWTDSDSPTVTGYKIEAPSGDQLKEVQKFASSGIGLHLTSGFENKEKMFAVGDIIQDGKNMIYVAIFPQGS